MNKDEDINVFEVEHSNFCHNALVDEHGNTQGVSSTKEILAGWRIHDQPYQVGSAKDCQSGLTGLEICEQSKETK